MGRTSKYETEVKPKMPLIEAWCRDGATDEIIAEKLEIALSTFYEYKKKYPEFSEALKRNKEFVDAEVENSLLKRALGYDYEEVTYECGLEVKRVKKRALPDTTAQIFWLKNRKPTVWRDKQEDRTNDEEDKVLIVNDLPK